MILEIRSLCTVCDWEPYVSQSILTSLVLLYAIDSLPTRYNSQLFLYNLLVLHQLGIQYAIQIDKSTWSFEGKTEFNGISSKSYQWMGMNCWWFQIWTKEIFKEELIVMFLVQIKVPHNRSTYTGTYLSLGLVTPLLSDLMALMKDMCGLVSWLHIQILII